MFPSGSFPGWGQRCTPKGQPPGNLFYHCPITVQTQGVVSGKPIIIWHESESREGPTRLLPLLLAVCLFLSAKRHLVSDSQRVFSAAYQLPSDSFTCNMQFCVGFKGNLTYIQTRKWIKHCIFSLSHFASLFLSQKHKHPSKRRAFWCLVFSCNSPGWTPRCVDNLHFDWCALEVSAHLFKSRCIGKQHRVAF